MRSYACLRYLHDAEYDSSLKFAHKLSFKALVPSTFERRNVKLALQVFNNFSAQAFKNSWRKTVIPYYENSSTFIKIIATVKGKRLQNVYEEPITKKLKLQIVKIFLIFCDLV